MNWEEVSSGPGHEEMTFRTAVNGGWLYAVVHQTEGRHYVTLETRAMAFVPDVVLCPHGDPGICMTCIVQAIQNK